MRIALLLVVAVVGCYRDSAPAKHVAVANTQHPPDHTREADDELAFLPKESELVVGLDLAMLRSSPAWREQIQPALESSSSFAKNKQLCGFDMLSVVTHVAFGVRKLDAGSEIVATAAGGDARQVIGCALKEMGDGKYTTQSDGDVTLVTRTQDTTPGVALSPVGPSHLVVVGAQNVDAKRVRAQLTSGAPLRGSPAFMTIYESLEHGASVWFIVNGSSALFQSLSLGIRPKYVDGTIIVSDHYVWTTRITMDSAADASQLGNMLRGMSAQVRQMVEELDIHEENAVLHVDVVVTQAQVQTILAMLGAFTGP